LLARQLDVLAAAGKLLKGEAALVAPLSKTTVRPFRVADIGESLGAVSQTSH